MGQHYSDPKRVSAATALPDLETFEVSKGTSPDCCPQCCNPNGTFEQDTAHNTEHCGWYIWVCQPGCLPDSDASGPFETEAEALADARDGQEDECEHGSAPDDCEYCCATCHDAGLIHVDYPHEPGYLLDCVACEDHCHCGRADGKPIEGQAACVFAECSDEGFCADCEEPTPEGTQHTCKGEDESEGE